MPAGRPSDYEPEFCETVIEMGREGASRAEMAAELEISHQTWYNWEKKHPEFLEATTRARHLAQGWWEKQGRKGIWSREFNASAYRLQMMNRFPKDWRDKQDVNVRTPDGIQVEEMTDEQLRTRGQQLQNRLAAIATAEPSTNGDGDT